MMGVGKYYDKKPVLQDISLSYFYGAKIGVIGLNGSGKSSLLRILAGVDKDFVGQTILSSGYTVGLLEQEPLLNDARTVRQVVGDGARAVEVASQGAEAADAEERVARGDPALPILAVGEVVRRGISHNPGVQPGVPHRLNPVGNVPALAAFYFYSIDLGLMRGFALKFIPAGDCPFLQFFFRSDHLKVAALFTYPNRQGKAPIAVFLAY